MNSRLESNLNIVFFLSCCALFKISQKYTEEPLHRSTALNLEDSNRKYLPEIWVRFTQFTSRTRRGNLRTRASTRASRGRRYKTEAPVETMKRGFGVWRAESIQVRRRATFPSTGRIKHLRHFRVCSFLRRACWLPERFKVFDSYVRKRSKLQQMEVFCAQLYSLTFASC